MKDISGFIALAIMTGGLTLFFSYWRKVKEAFKQSWSYFECADIDKCPHKRCKQSCNTFGNCDVCKSDNCTKCVFKENKGA